MTNYRLVEKSLILANIRDKKVSIIIDNYHLPIYILNIINY